MGIIGDDDDVVGRATRRRTTRLAGFRVNCDPTTTNARVLSRAKPGFRPVLPRDVRGNVPTVESGLALT